MQGTPAAAHSHTELVVRGEKAELALLSASVDSCERQVLLHEEAEEYFTTFPALKEMYS